MKLGYFTMPLHSSERNYTQTLKEDREAIILADELGYSEAFIGEHISDICETIPSCLSFIASLVDATKRIKLGSGTLNLPNGHPAQIASHVAMIDHMLEGRFLMGIGPGGLRSDQEIFENLNKDRNEMFVESINQILKIWSGKPPYNINGKYWNISTEQTFLSSVGQGVFIKPYQLPHPPIFVTVVVPNSKGLIAAAERGWKPITANFLNKAWIQSHWNMYVKGCNNVGSQANSDNWRIARSIFVADTDEIAKNYAKSISGPYGYYFNNLMQKRVARTSLDVYKPNLSISDAEVNLEFILNELVIAGSVESVVDQILKFRETVGDFGTLLYCGHDWVDSKLARRSMVLMAEQVIPKVNKIIG